MIEKHYQLKDIFKIELYLKDIINDFKKSDIWKIQLTITINFFLPKDDNDEENEMDSKRDNIEIMMKQVNLSKNVLSHSKKDTKISSNNQWKAVSLSSIMFIYCVINVIK